MKKLILFSILTLLAARSYADDYYWVGGAGSWSDLNHWASTSGGVANKSIVPSSEDDVYFDANSGLAAGTLVTLPTTGHAYCRNMSWAGVTTAAVFRNYGSFQLQVSGNLELSATVRYAIQTINFTGSTNATFRNNGAARVGYGLYNNFIVNKPGGSLTLLDGLTADGGVNNLVLTTGTLNMSGLNHEFGSLTANGATLRSLNITNATIKLGGTWDSRGSNMTLTAAGSTVTSDMFHSVGLTFSKVFAERNNPDMDIVGNTFEELTLAAANSNIGTQRIGANNTIGRLEFKGGGRLAGAGNVIGELILAPGKGYIFHGNNTINTLMRANTPDCDALGELRGADANAKLTFGAGATVDIRNVYVTSLTVAGSVAPVSAPGYDGGGNTGWNIQPMASGNSTLYWVGGAGNWNDKAHWSATSGGPGGACVPFITDNVIFDANSGFTGTSKTVSLTTTAWCHNMTWTNVANSPILATSGYPLEIWGSVSLDPTLTLQAVHTQYVRDVITLKGTEASTLTFNGCNLGNPLFNVDKTGTDGGITLTDNVTFPTCSLRVASGKFLMPGRTVNVAEFRSQTTAVRTLDFSNATINVNDWAIDARNAVSQNNGAGSFITAKVYFVVNGHAYPKVHSDAVINTVNITGTTIDELVFTSTSLTTDVTALSGNGGNTIGTLEVRCGGVDFRGTNTINNLLLAPSRTYYFRGTQTINGLFRFNSPDCNGLGELRDLDGTPAILNFGPSSTQDVNNVYLLNMTATGTGVPISVSGADAGGNTGFNITASAAGPRYWVGGSGDWNESAHWSTTSGGAGGACVPTVSNDVFFDANSFTAGSSAVTIAQGNAYCRNMDWTGAANAPSFTKTATLTLEIWGNLVMNPAVDNNVRVAFMGPANATFTSNSSSLGTLSMDIIKPAGSSLTFADNFNNPNSVIVLASGGLNLSGRTVNVSVVQDETQGKPTHMDIRNATISGKWQYIGSNKTIQAAGSRINATLFKVNGGEYNFVDVLTGSSANIGIGQTTITDLVFSAAIGTSQAYIAANNTIGRLEFKGRGLINGTGNTIGTLIFSPGMTYTFLNGSSTTITEEWFGSGTPCNLTEITSSTATGTFTVTKTAGDVEFDYVRLRNITAAGITPFRALEHSEDLGNNTNWNIAPYNGSTPILGLGPDITLCPTEFPHTLNTDGFFASPLASFAWSTGSTDKTITVTEPGTYSVSVTYPDGCSRSDNIVITRSDVTVAPITGNTAVCEGEATPLASTTTGGAWTTSDAAIATVSATGEVTGVAPGTATITYTVTNANGCGASQQQVMTVNDMPVVPATTGTLTLFAGGTTTLSNTTPDGVWASSNTAVATVDAAGVVTGVTGGTANISYTVTGTGGCTASSTVTVTVDAFSPNKRVLSITKTADAQEPTTNGNFTISLPASVNAEEDITITYTIGGTAGPTDYTPLTGTAILGAGQNSVDLPVIVTNDGFIENTETVEVTLGEATGASYTYTISTTNNIATVDILDDDNSPASRILSVITGSNGAEGGTAGRYYIGLPTGINASEDVSVTYTMSGKAINGTDYTNMTGSVVIPAGSNGADVFITVTDDKIIEGNEDVIITLTGGTSTSTGSFTVSATQGVASLVIVDNDNTAASRTLSVTTAGNASESGTNSSFTISLPTDMTAAEAITVNYTMSGTATNGEDYTAVAISAVIPAGENKVVIPITVTNDDLIELNETVTLTLGSNTSTNFTFPASTTAGSASLTIADNDNTPANRALTITRVADAAEPGTSGNFRVSLPAGVRTSQDIRVTYSVGAGTATPGTDYTAITWNVIIPAGSSDVLVPVTVIDNTVIEPTETVILNISGGNSTNFAFTVAPGGGSATVNITDNDFAGNSNVVLLTKVSDAIEGGTNGQYRISLQPGVTSSEDVVIRYVYGIPPPGVIAATPNTDFNLLGLSGGNIVIPAGANEVYIDVDAGNDGIFEGPEKVILNLTTAGSASYPFTVDPSNSSAAVDIIDANAVATTPLQVIAGGNAAEPTSHTSFTVKLAGVTTTSAWPVTVGYRVSGTATSGLDYESFGDIVIPRGVNSVTVDLKVKDDKIIEDLETMTFTLLSGSATDGSNVYVFEPDEAYKQITLLIADDDAALANNRRLSVVKTIDAAEPSAGGTFTVSLPAGYSSSANTTLTYSMGGTATRNTDYSVFTITLPAYSNSLSIPVRVTDDMIIEGTETVIMSLNGGTDGNDFIYTAMPGASTATMNLADDDVDPAKMVLSITNTGNAAEGAANGSFRISLPEGVTCAEDITVHYTASGTATAGSDFTALPSTFTIPAGDDGVTVTITVDDDDLVEKTETVTLTLTGGSADGGLTFTAGGNNSATVNIADNDSSPANTVISVAAGADITEGAGAATSFTISLPGSVLATEDVTVTYRITGTAVGGRDYNLLTGTAVIPAGQPSVTVNITAIDDPYIEDTETVILTLLSAASNSFSWSVSSTAGTATLNIADDDNTPANRTITVTKVTDGREPGTPGMFRFSLPDGVLVDGPVLVGYTINGTATPDADYTALTGIAEIRMGESGVNVPVTVLNDQEIEPAETVEIMVVDGHSPGIVFSGFGTAVVNIMDDESRVPANMTLTVSKTADAAEPGTNGSFTISLPSGITIAEDVTVTYNISGSATPDADYTALSGTAVITAGRSDVSVPVTVTDDQFIELDETVTITLTAGTSTNFNFTGTSNATVTIADNERTAPGSLELTVSKNADGAESGSNGSFTISLPTGVTATEDVTVNYTISGTATAGTDYTAITGAVTIPAGLPHVTVPVAIINDQVIEPTETVIMTLAGGTSTSFTFTGTGNAVVNIADDDNTAANRVLTLTKVNDAAEPGTTGRASVSLPANITTAEDITVTYTITGSATEDEDYAALTGTVIIPAGQGSAQIPVAVIDDQVIEPLENVTFTLTGGSSNGNAFTGSGSVTINITDNDNAPANLVLNVISNTTAAEPDIHSSFTISLPDGITATEDITVSYVTGGTATADDDYSALSGVAVIPAGSGSVDVPVTVVDDLLIEGTETLILEVTGGTSASFTLTPGDNNTASLDIMDDEADPAKLVVSVTRGADGAEPGANGSFTISLPAGVTPSAPITVTYTVAGTAAAGTDYTTLSGTAEIPAGGNSVSVPVTVTDDELVEGPETVTLTLTGASAAGITYILGTTEATVTIADDDATHLSLEVTASQPDAAEPAINGEFTISIAGGKRTLEPVTVAYTISGTATADADYQAIIGVITIPAGENSVTVPVRITDDLLVEDPETVTLTITGGQSAGFTYAAGAAQATVTITSEDVPVGDLIIIKEMVQPLTGPYRLGQDITYRITVRNIGNGIASGVVVTDTLPIQLGLPSNTTATGGQVTVNTDNKIVIWTIGEMLPNGSLQLEVRCRIVEGGALEATAEAGSTTMDADPSNNKATMRLQIDGQDMSFPNVFSPNGDGKNERFIIGGVEKYPGAKLQVFNRWGSQVYRSNDYRNDWNGSDLNEGTYFYILEVKKPDGIKTYKGWVLIVR
ncbi:Calx-beta domain-containing protein [Chitinophaga sp.]|uniref:Calx-beta domain-containing protein n=1 Tax=Chitinophaga sp. TaxID=1869181 RepID=UPI0031DED80A